MPLIDRDALIAKFRSLPGGTEITTRLFIKIADDAPAIDPVKHGSWLDFRAHDKDWLRDDGKSVFMECSVCHEKLCRNLMLSVNYCPSCGAKMDKEENQ